MELVIGNSLLLAFSIFEILIIKFVRKEVVPWKEIVTNFNSGHILLWVFRGVEIAAYHATFNNFSLDWVAKFPLGIQCLLAFVLWDFCFYWLHRLHHFFKILWGVHSVHHEGEHFSLSLGIRNSWYSSITSFPFFIVMALIGIPTSIFVAVSSIHYFIQFLNHNHLVNKMGFLEHFMVTPSHHRVHHGKNTPYRNKNFSGTFVIWDKLFHTFQMELDTTPVVYGIDTATDTNNPIVINNSPFVRLYSKHKKTKDKSSKRAIQFSDFMLVSAALLLFILLLFYIYFETQFTDQKSIILFAMIFIGTIGNGLLVDGNRLGIVVWCVCTFTFPVWLLNYSQFDLFLFSFILILFFIHGLFTLAITIKKSITNSR